MRRASTNPLAEWRARSIPRHSSSRVVGLFAALALGCAIKQVAPPSPPLSTVTNGERVLLLPARLLYESVATDQEVSGAEHGAEAIGLQLLSGLRAGFGKP